MRIGLCLLIILFFCGTPVHAGDYDFTIPEAEKTPFEFGGRLETRYVYHRLDQDSARYKLTYFRDNPGDDTHEWHGIAELSGSYQTGIARAYLLTHHEYAVTYETDEWTHDIYEGFVSLTPTAHLTLDIGKKRVLWGKGYAWNPAGFLNPPRDPDDQALNQEGRTLMGLDLIKSFNGSKLSNIGLTAMVLPVIEDWANETLGHEGDWNTTLKIYLLWYDTDLDFIYFDGPEQPRSFGLDFARNLAENFEVHGEVSFREDVPHIVIDTSGNTWEKNEDQLSYLLGVRYLNKFDTTFIAEYYHNGAGYNQDEIESFFTYQEAAFSQWQATGNASAMQSAGQITQPYYQQRNFGKDYVYLKVSQKEPFDILYFNPWVAAVINVQDFSFNLQPGLTWTPVTNLELNFRIGIPMGASKTEFGEKPDTLRPEVWMRYYL